MMDVVAYSVKDAAKAAGVSPRTIRKALYETGTLIARRVGSRVIVERIELARWCASLPRATSGAIKVTNEEVSK